MGLLNTMKGALGLGNSPSNMAASTTTVDTMPPATANNKKPALVSANSPLVSANANTLKGGRRRKRKSSRKTKKRSKRSKTSRRRN